MVAKDGLVNETNLSELVQVKSILKTLSCKLIIIKQYIIYKFKSIKVNMKKCISLFNSIKQTGYHYF